MSKKPTKPASAPVKNPDVLNVQYDKDESYEATLARLAMSPAFSNVVTVREYANKQWGSDNLYLTEMAAQLGKQAEAAQSGDLTRAEEMLMVQAHTLDAIFNNQAQRAASAIIMPHQEQYLRLALKAQNQCRATLETLANIKNPPIVYAKQANIANGPQQVNNGMHPAGAAPDPHARAEKQIQSNELLELQNGERLDTRTASAAGGANQQMAPVGAIHRPTND